MTQLTRMLTLSRIRRHNRSHTFPRIVTAGFVLMGAVLLVCGLTSTAQATESPNSPDTTAPNTTAPTAAAPTAAANTASTTAPTTAANAESSAPAAPSLSSQATAPQLFLNILSPMSYTVVVDKHRPLTPTDWVPPDIVEIPGIANPNGQGLRAAAASALEAMNAEAAANGVALVVNSAYRSFDTQTELYWRYVDQDGQAEADTYSARPGHSEHQTGLAVDITDGADCGFRTCFGETAPGQWVAANAYRYGYIVRYPDGFTAITGYMYEPWHLRFVGVLPATMMHNQGVATLEEFFHLDAAPDYLG